MPTMPPRKAKPPRRRAVPEREAKPSARAPAPRALHYKVVELSNVDEAALERTVNEWVALGWAFDGVQFAMRESSKRPSMAFVFFTREGAPLNGQPDEAEADGGRSVEVAQAHFARLVSEPQQASGPLPDAWERLKALADDEPGDA